MRQHEIVNSKTWQAHFTVSKLHIQDPRQNYVPDHRMIWVVTYESLNQKETNVQISQCPLLDRLQEPVRMEITGTDGVGH